MSWLEKQYDKHRKKVKKWNIQPGDFINLTSQYGDVWQEVKDVLNDYVLRYNPNGKCGEVNLVDMCAIRKLCRRENINKIKTCHIITAKHHFKRTFPMDSDAHSFQGDENIND